MFEVRRQQGATWWLDVAFVGRASNEVFQELQQRLRSAEAEVYSVPVGLSDDGGGDVTSPCNYEAHLGSDLPLDPAITKQSLVSGLLLGCLWTAGWLCILSQGHKGSF